VNAKSFIPFWIALSATTYFLGYYSGEDRIKAAQRDTKEAIEALNQAKQRLHEANEAAEVIFIQARKCMRKR